MPSRGCAKQMQTGTPEARAILASYERNANRIDPVAQEFLRDLRGH